MKFRKQQKVSFHFTVNEWKKSFRDSLSNGRLTRHPIHELLPCYIPIMKSTHVHSEQASRISLSVAVGLRRCRRGYRTVALHVKTICYQRNIFITIRDFYFRPIYQQSIRRISVYLSRRLPMFIRYTVNRLHDIVS